MSCKCGNKKPLRNIKKADSPLNLNQVHLGARINRASNIIGNVSSHVVLKNSVFDFSNVVCLLKFIDLTITRAHWLRKKIITLKTEQKLKKSPKPFCDRIIAEL